MNWKQTKYGDTILDVIKNRSGMEESEILHPKPIPPEAIENLTQAAALLQDAIQKKVPISIMGDYDVDGITASAILYYLIRFLGKQTPFIRLPRRMSEGYGLSVDAFDDFHQGLLITVDNGISATEEIAYAKDLGFSVLVIDHHLPGKFLPEADVIVDPHIHPDKNGFEHYCGAGLSLKLAELMLRDNPAASSLMDKLKVLATLGTIADVMPLVSDNRRIVMEGLRLWQSGSKAIPYGLTALVEAAEVYGRTETDIAFKIAPILNAPGRLLDNGAEKALDLLLAEPANDMDRYTAKKMAEELVEINERRKAAVADALSAATELVMEECMFGNSPLCIHLEGIQEGIVGIVAGKLAENYRVPAFVFTESSEPGILKGSGRSYGNVSMKELVDSASPYIHRGGGHEGAAGVSVKLEKYDQMVSAMQAYMSGIEWEADDTMEYDLEITADKVRDACAALAVYAPYGEGCPAPVFCVKNAVLVSRYGNQYKALGKEGLHLKLFCNGFSIICFNGTSKYTRMGKPTCVDLVGRISENKFQYATECQLEVDDFRATMRNPKTSPLLDALKRNGTI
ncbi:MAG: DHH family phosphoesterase [Methanocorpusculum sp.]|nr:DHH family phosphoesterase [Oscillospiraceae bacterium]MBQ3569616.1 DHH family phosphoesterase [Methanocorpusculum sp.]